MFRKNLKSLTSKLKLFPLLLLSIRNVYASDASALPACGNANEQSTPASETSLCNNDMNVVFTGENIFCYDIENSKIYKSASNSCTVKELEAHKYYVFKCSNNNSCIEQASLTDINETSDIYVVYYSENGETVTQISSNYYKDGKYLVCNSGTCKLANEDGYYLNPDTDSNQSAANIPLMQLNSGTFTAIEEVDSTGYYLDSSATGNLISCNSKNVCTSNPTSIGYYKNAYIDSAEYPILQCMDNNCLQWQVDTVETVDCSNNIGKLFYYNNNYVICINTESFLVMNEEEKLAQIIGTEGSIFGNSDLRYEIKISNNSIVLLYSTTSKDEWIDCLNNGKTDTCYKNCDKKYLLIDDKDYTWEQAKDYCTSLGSHLLTINSKTEQMYIENKILNTGTKNSYWLGGYKDESSNWHWITNEDFYYSQWASKQPNNDCNQDEDRLMIYKNNNFGYWNDLNGSGTCKEDTFFGLNNMGFICEWENEEKCEEVINDSSEIGNNSLVARLPKCKSRALVASDTEEEHQTNYYCISTTSIFGLYESEATGYLEEIKDEGIYAFEVERTANIDGYVVINTVYIGSTGTGFDNKKIKNPSNIAIYYCYNNICNQTFGYFQDSAGIYYEINSLNGGKILEEYVECNEDNHAGKMVREGNGPDYTYKFCVRNGLMVSEYSQNSSQIFKYYVIQNIKNNIFTNAQKNDNTSKYIVIRAENKTFCYFIPKSNEYCISTTNELSFTYNDICDGDENTCVSYFTCGSDGLCVDSTNTNILCTRTAACDPTNPDDFSDCNEGYYLYSTNDKSIILNGSGELYKCVNNGQSITCNKDDSVGYFRNSMKYDETYYIICTLKKNSFETICNSKFVNNFGCGYLGAGDLGGNGNYKFCINDNHEIDLKQITNRESYMINVRYITSESSTPDFAFANLINENVSYYYVLVDIIGQNVILRRNEHVKYRHTINNKLFDKSTKGEICLTEESRMNIVEYKMDQCSIDGVNGVIYYRIKNRE